MATQSTENSARNTSLGKADLPVGPFGSAGVPAGVLGTGETPGCCAPAKLEVCCEPEEKPTCCEPATDAAPTCGCA